MTKKPKKQSGLLQRMQNRIEQKPVTATSVQLAQQEAAGRKARLNFEVTERERVYYVNAARLDGTTLSKFLREALKERWGEVPEDFHVQGGKP